MVRVSGVPYEVDFDGVRTADYDRGFEDGCAYERAAILAFAKLQGMTPADIVRCIKERADLD